MKAQEFQLIMIKFFLVVITSAFVLIMVSGISLLKENYYFRTRFVELQIDYAKAEIDYLRYAQANVTDWITRPVIQTAFSSTPEGKADSIPILLYHGVIADPQWQPDEVSIRLDDFRHQLFALKKNGWQTVSLEDYIAFTKGDKTLPEKSFIITFDDGRKDSFYPVDPILRALGYTAIMNVITGRSLLQSDAHSAFHLTPLELRQMRDSGRWQLASHGRFDHDLQVIAEDGRKGHFLSNLLWLEKERRMETKNEYQQRILNDLLGSKSDLEEYLGVTTLAFAYPFGDFGQATDNLPDSQAIIADTISKIYDLTFYQVGNGDFATNYREDSSLARRINVNSFMETDALLKLMNDTQKKSIPYADSFTHNNGWRKGWGTLRVNNHLLMLSRSKDDDSGLAFLDGSFQWQNYYAQAQTRVKNITAFSIAARYQDDKNYLACNYYPDRVALMQKLKNQEAQLSERDFFTGLQNKPATVGIYVKDDQATCFLNGKAVVSAKIDQSLSQGGIGFKIWDTPDADSSLAIQELNVYNEPVGYSSQTATVQSKNNRF